MDKNTSDNIFYTFVMFAGVGVYAFCIYLSFAFMRVAKLCSNTGGVVSIGIIVGVIPIILPLYLMGYSEEKYLNKRPCQKIWMYILCALLVAGIITYSLFIDVDLIKGRDITLDMFLVLYLFTLPIVFAIRCYRYYYPWGKTRRKRKKQKHPTD